MSLPRFHHLASFAVLLAVSTAAPNAQDEENQSTDPPSEQSESPEQDQEQGQQASQADETVAVTAKLKQPERRTLYFLGPDLKLERQIGPSIGTPKSILPQPLVAKGTIQVPEAQPLLPNAGAPVPDRLERDAGEGMPPEGTAPDGVDSDPFGDVLTAPQDAGTNADALQDEGTLPATEETPDGLSDQTVGVFQEGVLERMDPSGFPVGQGLDTVWQGYSRERIIEFLTLLSQPSLSPALSRFASAVAASRFDVPEPSSDQDVMDFLAARLSVFQSQADRAAYVGLLDALPADQDWNALGHHIARAHLLKGELTDACFVADARRADDADPYWVRLSAFCMAANGNRAGVDFQLGILEETTSVDPVFYQLIDQILVEAEQLPGAVLPPVTELNGLLPVDILSAAMARLARVTVQDLDVSNVNPLAVPLLLENPMVSRTVQNKLIAYLLDRGIPVASQVMQVIEALEIPEDEIMAVRSWIAAQAAALEGTGLDAGTVDAPMSSELPFEEADLQTVLLSMAIREGGDAPMAVREFWRLAGLSGQQAAVSPVLAAALKSNAASPFIEFSDTLLIAAHAAHLSGDAKTAEQWSRQLRVSVAGENADLDAALIANWPVMAMAGNMSLTKPSVVSRWLQAQGVGQNVSQNIGQSVDQNATQNSGQDYCRQANLVFTLLEAMGDTLGDKQWAALESGPALFSGGSLSPAMWRRYLVAIQHEDPVELLGALYRIALEVGPADLPPAVAGTLVAGLQTMNFEQTARAFALEILISQQK